MSLHVDVELHRDGFRLAADLRLPDGQVLAVLGANGAGKSTLLDVIAGLQRPTRGAVRLGGRDLTHTPPHRRRIGLLRQDPLLFPHLSALDNVAFGIRLRGRGRRAARAEARRWLEHVHVGDLAHRRPGQLSGGQAQRVGIARVLATEPELLLLDEPFKALDAATTPALRTLVQDVLAESGHQAIVVTHDPADARALADTALVLAGGAITARGDVDMVLAHYDEQPGPVHQQARLP